MPIGVADTDNASLHRVAAQPAFPRGVEETVRDPGLNRDGMGQHEEAVASMGTSR